MENNVDLKTNFFFARKGLKHIVAFSKAWKQSVQSPPNSLVPIAVANIRLSKEHESDSSDSL